jgi:hypothetical protein
MDIWSHNNIFVSQKKKGKKNIELNKSYFVYRIILKHPVYINIHDIH